MINKVIYIKYDELCLKGNNIDFFKHKLISNIKNALKGFDLEINVHYDNIVIYPKQEKNLALVLGIIKKIPGIGNTSIGYEIDRDLDLLYRLCFLILKPKKTFKIEVKRSDKQYQHNSDELKRMVAKFILENNPNIKVDIHHPETKIWIEVKKNNFIVYSNKIKCACGLPVGTSGKVLMLLSGGIDSPVASNLLLKRGMHVDFLTFMTPPFTTNESLDKVKELVKILTVNYNLEKPKLYVCNFTPIQNELTHMENESYRITLLRRSFIRIANVVAKQLEYDALATGESLGQVASQTIESINVINEATSKTILRPLIALNKEQIIEIAKNIGTYDVSISKHPDSCSLFAPKNPVTKPKLELAKSLESKLSLLQDIEWSTVKKIEVIDYDKE